MIQLSNNNIFLSGIIFTLFLLLFSGGMIAADNQTTTQTPAAMVNGEKISRSALDERVSQKVKQDIMQVVQIAMRYNPNFAQFLYSNKTVRKEYSDFLRGTILDTMIEETLKEQKIEEKGLTVKDQEVKKAVDEQIQSIIDQNKQFSSPKDIDKYLQKNRSSSLEQFKELLREQKRDTLLLEKLKTQVLGPKKEPTQEEIKNYYKNNEKQFTDESGKVKPLSEVKSQIVSELNKQKEQQRAQSWQEWLKKIKKEADIKKNL